VKHGPHDLSTVVGEAESLGVPISVEQASKILELESALRDRASRVGAISVGDVPRMRKRHILDSLRAAVAVTESDRDAYDLGSGGGFPGIPVAIARPSLGVTLVERRGRRAGLLEWLIERLELSNARVLARRIEDLKAPADLCFARALAPIERTWRLASPLLRPGGRLVYFAGPRAGMPARMSGVDVSVIPPDHDLLERAGPLVIMTRE
jgi:16S rRNA (guanine527-N7)-methyltransferase